MRPTDPNIDKETVTWSLSWHPEDRCDSFTREAILAHAPSTSGVYGLFNFDCQIFIGESANIQAALLRHESETDFQSQHLRPTGFTFECCAAELRKTKADGLIARFRPVLQTEAALIEAWSPIDDQMASEAAEGGQNLEPSADHREFPRHERGERTKTTWRFHVTRKQGAALAALFVASALFVFYLRMPDDYAIQKRASGANPVQGQAESESTSLKAPAVDTAVALSKQNSGAKPAKREVRASASAPNGALQVAAKSATRESLATPAETGPIVHASGSSNSSQKWSVQIAAAPAKDIADSLAQQLKAEGYDGYVVRAEVKGQTYYRVRVGHFGTQEQAESARQSLARQNGYQDAYLTND